MRPILVLIALLVSAPALAGETIKGKAVALDCDTILVFATPGADPVTARLWG